LEFGIQNSKFKIQNSKFKIQKVDGTALLDPAGLLIGGMNLCGVAGIEVPLPK
jgi:hypothetical protein